MNKNKLLIPIIILTLIIILLVIIINPSRRYSSLYVLNNEFNSIKSSRTEDNNLQLQEITFNDYELIIDHNSSTLYYSIVNNNSDKYDPLVSYISNQNNVKLAVLKDEITDDKINGNYQFQLIIYNDYYFHTYKLICTGFPIINISYSDDQANKDKNINCNIYMFDNQSNQPNRTMITPAKLDLRSANNGLEYKISLQMLTPGKNKRENNQSIFNQKPEDDYILSKANTNSSFEAGNNYIELFINGEYKGLYVMRHNNPNNNSNNNTNMPVPNFEQDMIEKRRNIYEEGY